MKNILITGVNGFIGRYVAEYLTNKGYNVTGIDISKSSINKKLNFITCDIRDTEKIQQVIIQNNINVVIHSAAIKSIPQCEKDQKTAIDINYVATKKLQEVCEKNNAFLIFISSDIVFDGRRGNYNELDVTNPINTYGKSKVLCEEWLRNKDVAIVRTAMVFGSIRKNDRKHATEIFESDTLVVQGYFLDHIVDRLSKKKSIKLPVDEYMNPTSVHFLCKLLESIILKKENGIFHFCGNEAISRFELGVLVAELFSLDKSLIIPIKNNDPLRPKNVSLNNHWTLHKLNMESPTLKEMIVEEKNDI